MNPLVSVVVPVYNTLPFLDECVGSIMRQTVQDIEIILVDDGSTDGSSELLDRYSREDERIKVIHQENAGVSAARNKGIELACGNWIMFVDSDDWLESIAVQTLLNGAKKTECDLVFATGYIVTNGRKERIGKEDFPDIVFHIDDCREYFLGSCLTPFHYIRMPIPEEILSYSSLMMYPVMKLYRKSSLANLRFAAGLRAGEDQLFNFRYCEDASTAVFVNTPIYNYRTRKSSASHTFKGDLKKYIDYADICGPYIEMETSPVLREIWNARLREFIFVAVQWFSMLSSSPADFDTYSLELHQMAAHRAYKQALEDFDPALVNGTNRIFVLTLLRKKAFHFALLYLFLFYKLFPQKNILKF